VDIIFASLIYIIPALIIIWFLVNMVATARRRNIILQEIADTLKKDRENAKENQS
jgi:uncharacterized membrane protein